jgi:tetratricopeptide (TPR) repeat protein
LSASHRFQSSNLVHFFHRPFAHLLLSAGLATVSQTAGAQVHVWEGTLNLPTYQEGPPNLSPPFDEFTSTKFIYPYTTRNNLTDHREEHAWRAVYLENKYLKCSILPDLGGRIYTCVDKISNQSMFYANSSVKKADLAYRGSWAALGVEFNFPVSHNWVTVSPVDFSYSNHEDGSGSVTVGNIDRVYGMQWNVELILRPGSTVLEERVTLNNRSDVRHRFYWWSNAGVQVWDDSRICYPMQFTAAHGFVDIDTWPVDSSGTDLSLPGNHTKGSVSRFAYGSREPFIGVWNSITNTGSVHFSEYEDLPGKKVFSWGVDANALNWRKALSDDNSEYLEVQSGLFRNQETYAFLEPRQTIHFSEYWMPVRGLGGIARANLNAVVNLSRQNGTLTVGLNPNRAMPGAEVRILKGSAVLFSEKVDLAPERNWTHQVASADPEAKYTFELSDNSGTLLLRQTEGQYDWTPKSEVHLGLQHTYRVPAVVAERTEDDWLQLGKADELNGKLLVAVNDYKDGMAKFPHSLSIEKASGRLASSQLHYEEAIKYLEDAQSRETSNSEIAYYLGIAYEGVGQNRNALTALETAQRMPDFHAAADLRLGELQAREGALQASFANIAEAQRTAPDDLRSAEELVAIENARDEKDVAHTLASKWLSEYPTSYFLAEELGKPDLRHLAADPERVLNVAAEYMRLGLYARALEVLSREYPSVPADQGEPGVVLPQDNPMVAYFSGYCKEKLGGSGKEDYARASGLSVKYIFPSDAMEYEVLRAVSQSNPKDATARYLMGMLHFSVGLTDAAMSDWEEARSLNPNIPTIDASLGLAQLNIKLDSKIALSTFEEGTKYDPNDEQIYMGIDQALSLLKRPAVDRIEAISRYPDQAGMSSPLVYELALNKTEAGNYDGAIDVFRNRFFVRQEFGTDVQEVWVEVHLQHVLAMAKEAHCEVALKEAAGLGVPVADVYFSRNGLEPIINSARTRYLLGTLDADCGRTKEARAQFEQASRMDDPAQIVWASRAAKKLGGYDETQWHSRLQAALERVRASIETSLYTTWWTFNAGMIQQELGDNEAAEAEFRHTLLMPDQMMAYHLTRLELSGAQAQVR